jgi:redox-sensitive bicupin YhaK (pirin superfamily)
VAAEDARPDEAACGEPHAPEVEVSESREASVGGIAVRRALPRRQRRTVGAWCFADHFGPVAVAGPGGGMDIGPHPHTGLHSVTWLLAGGLLHRDSLGSEQPIRPGQLNLMTAGQGVAHAEETEAEARAGDQHGIQLWVAQPERTRNGTAAFEHHAELPQVGIGPARVTVLIGELGGAASPARHDTPLVGAELASDGGRFAVPLDPSYEHALVVLTGSLAVGGTPVTPGHLAYLGLGREQLDVEAGGETRALLLGGEPLGEQIVMSWNFVGRSRAEVAQAAADWNAEAERFGVVDSARARIPAPVP